MHRPVCLLCEDEALIAFDLEDCLQEAGLRVAGPFASGEEALAWVGGNTPDLAVLDFRLSDGVCTPLIRMLRERQVPVVIQSGWQLDEGDTPPELDGVPWLSKPLERETLLKALAQAVRSQKPEEDTNAVPISLSSLANTARRGPASTSRGMTRALIDRLAALAPLSPEERDALADAVMRTVSLTGGQDIVQAGDGIADCHVLFSGMAASYKMLPEGNRQIVALNVAGDILDLDGFVGRGMDHSVVALGPCQVGVVTHQVLRALTMAHPGIAQALWRHTAADGAVYREWVVNVGQRPAQERIAHLICEVFTRLKEVGLATTIKDICTFLWPLTQLQIGEATGLSAVHVNRTLQELRARRLIELARDHVTILDWQGLARLANFSPTYLRRMDAA